MNLKVLSLDGNKLTGAVPPGIFNLTHLTSLRLSNNDLTGMFPNKSGHLCIQSIGIPDYGDSTWIFQESDVYKMHLIFFGFYSDGILLGFLGLIISIIVQRS